jgi:hypothetical protein
MKTVTILFLLSGLFASTGCADKNRYDVVSVKGVDGDDVCLIVDKQTGNFRTIYHDYPYSFTSQDYFFELDSFAPVRKSQISKIE